MSAGPSLYRRHRPRTFADVVGQEHVVRTLSHAVERNKVHHAYLFVGSRGTGKTSMAKILASCLNCVDGPTITPCGVCDSCVSIASATSMDVIEMDAASNNSVDDIRDLRETVAYAPVSGRHKVYILDEAHMLSPQAWNAFLKTLEEPPPNTVFVLATTEAQKVLPTVVDRCHRFDFGRPAADQIAGLLRRVAGQESIDLEDGAAALIARHATGSFRDALGTLEQLVDYAGEGAITPADVMAVLGVADAEQLFNAVEAIIARDPGAALAAAAGLSSSGRDPGQVLRDLESHARELLTVQVIGAVPPELAVTADRDARLVRQAKELVRTDAVRLLDLLSGALDAAANGAQSRIQLELVLIRAAAPEFDPSVSALLSRIERLEKGAAPRAVVAPAPVAAPAPSPVVSPVAAAPSPTPVAATVTAPAPSPATAASSAPQPVAPQPAAPQPAAPQPAAPEPEYGDPGPWDYGDPGPSEYAESARATPPVPRQPAPTPAAPAQRAPTHAAPPQPEPVHTEPAQPAPASVPPAAPEPAPHVAADGITPEQLRPPAVPAVPDSTDIIQLQELWPAVIELIRSQNPLTAGLLAGARPVAMSEHELVVELPTLSEFQKRKFESGEHHRRAAIDAVRNVTGASLELTYQLAAAAPAKVETTAEVDDNLSTDELVTRFVEEFDAQEVNDQEPT